MVVFGSGTPTENGAELKSVYNAAKLLSPSSDNILEVVVAPGYYSLSSALTVDTQYINITSLTGGMDVVINGDVNVSANNIQITGLNLNSYNLILGDDLNAIIVSKCKSIGNNSFGRGLKVSGKFYDCVGGARSFGGGSESAEASGEFYRCSCISGGFGGFLGTASGKFYDCVSYGGLAFGGAGTCTETSRFYNCQNLSAEGGCFGGYYTGAPTGTFAGKAFNCISYGIESFGSAALTGQLYYCVTAGSFINVSGAGKTFYCIAGDTPNNQ